MTRILLIGASGQLGQELQLTLPALGDVVIASRNRLELTDSKAIRQTLGDLQPEWIINAAAYTAVDQAEKEVDLAFAVNSIAPQMMAEAARELGSILFQISTDYVFDGQQNTPYQETDRTHPLSVYGQSKLAGEIAIQQSGARAMILRTAWVYGMFGQRNFVKTMLRIGQERETIRVVADQIGTPTWAKDIAEAIAQLMAQQPLDDTSKNVTWFHFTNSGIASWYDFAVAIFEEAAALKFPLRVKEIIPITTADYPTSAQRPPYSVLSTQKLRQTLGQIPAHWRQSLRQMLTQLSSQLL